MEYMLDTANLAQIRECVDLFPISGVTTNPTILKAEGSVSLREHLLAIRALCGNTRMLHVQLLSDTCEEMIAEADAVRALLGATTHVKIPVTEQGVKAIRLIKAKGTCVTATAVYYLAQGLMAVEAGADYIAPYCNRMESNDIDFRHILETMRRLIDRDHYQARIVAASFKNVTQINDAFAYGAHAATVSPELLRAPFSSPLVTEAVQTFAKDFALYYGNHGLTNALR